MTAPEVTCTGCGMSATVDRLDTALDEHGQGCYSCPVCGARIDPVAGYDYEVACCLVCGSSDPDMALHQECMEPEPFPDPEDTYPGRV